MEPWRLELERETVSRWENLRLTWNVSSRESKNYQEEYRGRAAGPGQARVEENTKEQESKTPMRPILSLILLRVVVLIEGGSYVAAINYSRSCPVSDETFW